MWTGIWRVEHGRGFIVAGAAKDELIGGFHQAISEGRTLADFRKDFDRLVKDHGWSYNGSRGWRSAVIYDTNLSQAYSAGRWQQAKKLDDPVGRYVHIKSEHERPEHAAWHGTTLPLSHSWWGAHWPINGWGCHCSVDVLSKSAAARAGWKVAADGPADVMETRTVNMPGGPKQVTVPKGIDPGFDYNPGEAAFGHQLNRDVMDPWRRDGRKYERLSKGGWKEAGRPQIVPADPPQAKLGPPARSPDSMVDLVRKAIGGEERIFTMPDGGRVLVDATALGEHLSKDLGRAAFLPLLAEVIENPFEVWLAFERHPATGKVELRRRLIKIFDLGPKQRPLVFTARDGLKPTPITPCGRTNSARSGWENCCMGGRMETSPRRPARHPAMVNGAVPDHRLRPMIMDLLRSIFNLHLRAPLGRTLGGGDPDVPPPCAIPR